MNWTAAEEVGWSSDCQLTLISNRSLHNGFSFALMRER
jgi:hypothetical protein